MICKPDAVERGYVGEILSRFERKGLKIARAELRTLDSATLAKHYEEHVGKGFYDELVAFMSRSPAFVITVRATGLLWRGRQRSLPDWPVKAPRPSMR